MNSNTRTLIALIALITAIFTFPACFGGSDCCENEGDVVYTDPHYPQSQQLKVADATISFSLQVNDSEGERIFAVNAGQEYIITVFPYNDQCVDLTIHAHGGTSFGLTTRWTFWFWDPRWDTYTKYAAGTWLQVNADPGTSTTAICYE